MRRGDSHSVGRTCSTQSSTSGNKRPTGSASLPPPARHSRRRSALESLKGHPCGGDYFLRRLASLSGLCCSRLFKTLLKRGHQVDRSIGRISSRRRINDLLTGDFLLIAFTVEPV